MILDKLYKANVISPPKWLINNTVMLTITGSDAYGVTAGSSDIDIYGYCIPHKSDVFPHLKGEIPGFGRQFQRFDQWQEHHIKAPDSKTEYDFTVFGIIKYFQLCMENNPNMIDTLFTPRRCVVHSTQISELVRERRKIFLHKGAWFKFKGYAFAQMSKIATKQNASNPKRDADIQKFGYDTKFAYHLVRLMCEVEQIMIEHDLDLERSREQLKVIRRGEWTLERLQKWFADKEISLEGVYATSTLPNSPDEGPIKQLLLECLEHHYGSLHEAVVLDVDVDKMLDEIAHVVNRYRRS